MLSTISVVAFCAIALHQLSAYLGRSLRRKQIEKETALADLPFLGEARPKGQKIKGTAVICGGSIAGLATARVCHDHFDRVVVVEPEAWLTTSEGWDPAQQPQKSRRTRIMQYESIQAFQAFGLLSLKKMFTAVEEECKKFDLRILPADVKLSSWGYSTVVPYEEYHNDLPKTIVGSRPGVESLLRQLVIGRKEYPNIEQIIGTVAGVTRSSTDPTRLQDVTVRTSEGNISVPAALVVDCTGPAQGSLKWLPRAGFDISDSHSKDDDPTKHGLEKLKDVYDHNTRYATVHFSLTPDQMKRLPIPYQYDTVGVIYACYTDARYDRKTVMAQRTERDQIHITCGLRGEDQPPHKLEDIKAFTRALIMSKPVPDWYLEFLDALGEVEDTMTYSVVRVPPAAYVRYQQASSLPANWVALGDSVMRVNPTYGQGCNKAIIGAVTLNTVLRSVAPSSTTLPLDFSRRFFDAHTAKVDSIWLGTKTIDYGYDSTIPVQGETLSHGSLMRWYMRRLTRVAFRDPQAGSALWHVSNFLAPGIDVFQPGLLFKVFWNALTTSDA